MSEELPKAENERVESCFEGIDARYLLAELYRKEDEEKSRKKLIAGERGTGKTHLTRLFSQEEDVDMFELDKERLFYGKEAKINKIEKTRSPKFAILDDVHYLLKGVDFWKNDPEHEEIAIDLVEWFGEQYDDDTTQVYVTDRGPATLADFHLEERKYKKAFLDLMPKVAKDSSDLKIRENIGVKVEPVYVGKNLVDLDKRATGLSSIDRFARQKEEGESYNEELEGLIESFSEKDLDKYQTNLANLFGDEFDLGKIPLGKPKNLYHQNLGYVVSKDDSLYPSKVYVQARWGDKAYFLQDAEKPILTTRHLKVLDDKLDEVSIESIGLSEERGKRSDGKEYDWDKMSPDFLPKKLSGGFLPRWEKINEEEFRSFNKTYSRARRNSLVKSKYKKLRSAEKAKKPNRPGGVPYELEGKEWKFAGRKYKPELVVYTNDELDEIRKEALEIFYEEIDSPKDDEVKALALGEQFYHDLNVLEDMELEK